VFDLASILSLVPVIALVASLVVVRRLAGDQPIDLAALFGHATPMPWPRGVQEEEPQPWRLERLERRRTAAAPKTATMTAGGTCRAEGSRVAV
jgi:hypothetical protein